MTDEEPPRRPNRRIQRWIFLLFFSLFVLGVMAISALLRTNAGP